MLIHVYPQTCWLLVLWSGRSICIQVLGCKQGVSGLLLLSLPLNSPRSLGVVRRCVRHADNSRSACADTRHSKRVFLLGPSHHFYLEKAALTRCTHYGTPLGSLPIDSATTADLHKTGQFDWMSQDVDEDEHSLEMHIPYIYKMLSK